MSRFSQPQRVFELLKQSPLKKFKARDIAEGIVTLFPEDYVKNEKIHASKPIMSLLVKCLLKLAHTNIVS